MAVNPNSTTYPEAQRVETYPVHEVQPAVYVTIPEAAQRVYDRGSIADTLQRMFNEAEQSPGMYMDQEDMYAETMNASHADSYKEVMREIQNIVMESPSVKHLRSVVQHNSNTENPDEKKEITPSEVEAVFRAYEQAFHRAMRELKSDMKDKDYRVMKFQAQSELDYSFRDVITRHLVLGSEQQMKFDPLDFFLLANPKVRKVDYMTNKEILETLKHSMTIQSMRTDRLRGDLRAVESRSHRADYQELMATDQVRKLQLEGRPQNT